MTGDESGGDLSGLLKALGIRAVRVPGISDDGGNAVAVLQELAELLDNLIRTDASAIINLGEIPLSDNDLQLLEETLGEGEIHAEVQALGLIEVRETGIPGVWWISHFDERERVTGEFLEVSYCPEILISPQEEVKAGLSSLRAHLFGLSRGNRR